MTELSPTESTYESERYFEKLRRDRKIDNLIEILSDFEHFNLKCAVTMLTVNQLRETLQQFAIKDEYSDEQRALFYYINIELTRRNIAPIWRCINKIPYSKLTLAQKRYACDIQIIDLQWTHSAHNGHKIINTDWDRLSDRIFEKESFDYIKADNIANAGLTNKEKVRFLKLTDSMQTELNVLRSEKIKKRVTRAIKASHEVETNIFDAAYLNPRRGKKTAAQAGIWSKLWLCRKLAGRRPDNISKLYTQMTGENISHSTLRNKLNRIAAALAEVNSPYYKDMISKD